VLTTDRKLYVWGDNYSGELMIGNQITYKGLVSNTHLPLERITDFEVKGTHFKYLLSGGRVYEYASPQKQNYQEAAPE
jgi:alpha-tubulin suppressor-like RCC1 family protein